MLKKQLYRLYMITLFLPVLVLGLFLLYNNYTLLYQHHEEMLKSDNIRIKSIMFEVTTSITNICDYISENDALHQLIATEYGSEIEARRAQAQFTILGDYYNRHTDIASITVYTDNQTLKTTDHIKVIDADSREWYRQQMSTSGYYWSTLKGINSVDLPYQEMQLSHKINIPNSDMDALIVITVSNNYLKNRIENNAMETDITVNDDAVFYSTWGNADLMIDFNGYEKEAYYNYSGIGSYIGNDQLMEVSTIKPYKSEDSIYVFSSNPYALDDIKRILLVNALIVVMSISLPMFIIIKFTDQLSERVNTLRTEMHRVTGGDFNIIENFKGNDELVDLFHDLQTMITSIKERDQAIFDGRMKEQQLINHQQKMEMELLSSKINPHFLYNTLETIRMKAFNSDDIEVANAVKLLGRYMRYNLESTGGTTTLEEELSFIKVYLEIQGLRFSNRIKSDIFVEKEVRTDQIYILPLIIQPIVENAFIHAHEETLEDGIIFISVLKKENHIRIQVEDNGMGIGEEKLRFIKDQLDQPYHNEENGEHIGLNNIHQRLKLFYGDDYGLEIHSTEDVGTIIEFDIPELIEGV